MATRVAVYSARMSVGEQHQQRGEDGVRKAKQWLARTTRAEILWSAYDEGHAKKLVVPFEDSENQSFDMAGILRGEALDKLQFYAEVKNYEKATTGDLPASFGKFLRLCYRALQYDTDRFDRFMWISWTPFSLNKWHRLTEATHIAEQVQEFGVPGGGSADSEICRMVGERLWVIILSPGVESLVATEGSLRALAAAGVGRGGGAL